MVWKTLLTYLVSRGKLLLNSFCLVGVKMRKKLDTLCKNRYISGAESSFKVLFVGDNLTRDDCDHMTLDLGRYIVGLTFVSALTGLCPDTLSDRQIAVAKESAQNALANPFAVTPSAFK